MNQPARGHRARKRFGQNFLHDPGVIHRIVTAINPRAEEALVEIGPGKGALTESLLAVNPRLQVLELDRDLIPLLRERFAGYPEFRIHQGDALRFDFHTLFRDRPLRILGNLPYNISTPLIFHLLMQADIIADMHFLLQKEVVERLAAQPGSGAYGRLSVMAQYACRVQPLFEVGPGAFRPAPKVTSALVRLIPHQSLPHEARDPRMLERVVRTAFSARRKTLRRALAVLIDSERLERLGVDSGLRPENLSLAQFVAIADAITPEGGRD